jgi:chemotaxis signal transduction protein
MSSNGTDAIDHAALLREGFDRSFAQAPAPKMASPEGLLAIRVGADRYVFRVTEISGLFTCKNITPLPSPLPELLGIAGFRGTVLPVYDLGMLLGYPRSGIQRWVVVAATAPAALAFEDFDGYTSTSTGTIVAADTRSRTNSSYVRDVLHAEVARPVIDLSSVIATIRERSGRGSAIR